MFAIDACFPYSIIILDTIPGTKEGDMDDILFVGFVLGHGGDAMQMLELAAGMAKRGKRVRIVVPELKTTAAFAERCQERGVPVERSRLLRADAHAARQNPLDLLRLFHTHRARQLHLHTGDVCLPRMVPLVMALLRLPRAFVTVHSPYDTLQPGDARARAWVSATTHRFRKVICPSTHGLQTQIRYGVPRERLLHIPNGVDVARYGSGDGMRIRRELGLEAENPLLVFTSRPEAQKRPFDALEAFVQIASEFPTAHLAFVGQGELEGELQQRAEQAGLRKRVHFPGYRSDIPDWLAAATVWLLPTETENFSLALLEALAAGCPVLSTLCPGNDEVLVAGSNALIHAIGDVAGIASSLRLLLTSPALRTRLGVQGRHTAQNYTLECMVEQYASCYEEVS